MNVFLILIDVTSISLCWEKVPHYYYSDAYSISLSLQKFSYLQHLYSVRWQLQLLLLLVEQGASMKSFQALRSLAIPLASYHNFSLLLFSSSIVLHRVIFGLPLLLYPWGFQSNAVFSVAPAFCVMCVQSNSIFFFLSEFQLVSVWWLSIILHL